MRMVALSEEPNSENASILPAQRMAGSVKLHCGGDHRIERLERAD